jgi:hypothetical protein
VRRSQTFKTPSANISLFVTNCRRMVTFARSKWRVDVPKLAGVNHQDAVRALAKAGFRVAREAKHIVMTDGQRIVTIPRHNPVNAYAIVQIPGVEDESHCHPLLRLLSLGAVRRPCGGAASARAWNRRRDDPRALRRVQGAGGRRDRHRRRDVCGTRNASVRAQSCQRRARPVVRITTGSGHEIIGFSGVEPSMTSLDEEKEA